VQVRCCLTAAGRRRARSPYRRSICRGRRAATAIIATVPPSTASFRFVCGLPVVSHARPRTCGEIVGLTVARGQAQAGHGSTCRTADGPAGAVTYRDGPTVACGVSAPCRFRTRFVSAPTIVLACRTPAYVGESGQLAACCRCGQRAGNSVVCGYQIRAASPAAFSPVRAENPDRGSDQRSCAPAVQR
jgi:hypothetical protein